VTPFGSTHEGRLVGVTTVVLTLIGWSSIPLFLKHFSHSIDAWTSNGWRYGFSALIWLPLVILVWQRRRLPRGIWKLALVPGIVNAAGQVVFTWAHYKIDPGLLTFGLRSHIVFVSIGAAILFPVERKIVRSPGFIGGIVLVLAGTVGMVVLGPGFGSAANTFGVTLALMAGALFAGYALSVRWFMHGVSPLVAFAVISQYTATLMVLLMLGLGDQAGARALAMSPGQFTLLLVSAVIGIALGHVFYYISIARLGVAVSAGVLQLQPIVVSVASVVLFGEVLTGWQWVFGAVAIAGAGWVLVTQHRISRRRAPEIDLVTEFKDLPVDHVAGAVASEDEPVGSRG
jgi:drug/metabolite transporter (DMT)-like permease